MSNEKQEIQPVVIDNGSSSCKIGFAGDDEPKSVFPTLIGKPKNDQLLCLKQKPEYIGYDAFLRRDVLTLNYPVENGIIQDWDDMKVCFHSWIVD